MESTVDLAIRRSVEVNADVERAFDVFTRDLPTWWPLDTHSVRADRGFGAADSLHLEPWQGGRFYEKTGNEELRWGCVLTWDPPCRIVLEWQVNPERPPTEVEVVFTPEEEGTFVEVVHAGWEFAGPAGQEERAGYAGDAGWNWLLRRYAETAAAAAAKT
jgi:uncharacterized protein YndB with AHSA1/START domain